MERTSTKALTSCQAAVVIAYIQWLQHLDVQPSEIAVVTPYRAQAALSLGCVRRGRVCCLLAPAPGTTTELVAPVQMVTTSIISVRGLQWLVG